MLKHIFGNEAVSELTKKQKKVKQFLKNFGKLCGAAQNVKLFLHQSNKKLVHEGFPTPSASLKFIIRMYI